MLGVRKSTCNEFPYVELGKPTLTSIVLARQLKFYRNCMVNKDLPLQRYIIRKALDSNCSFIMHYVELDSSYNCPEDITKQSLIAMQNSIQTKAAANHSRYKTYLEINPLLKRPVFNERYIPMHKLQKINRLRMISHDLKVEKGRHHKNPVPIENRLCRCGEIENEKHFIMNCRYYSHIRTKYNELHCLTFDQQLDNILSPDFVSELIECRKMYQSVN